MFKSVINKDLYENDNLICNFFINFQWQELFARKPREGEEDPGVNVIKLYLTFIAKVQYKCAF